jgi:4-hydroxy-4-methyl-2-oxoglutarate aldolase
MATKVHNPLPNSMTHGARQGWASVPVTILSDVTSGRSLVEPRIRPLRAFKLGTRMVGQAVTAWCERADFGPCLHAINIANEGDIVVIDAGGDLGTAYVGELLCATARRKKIAGLIINGAVRDVDTIASWTDFPVYCLGSTARGPLSKDCGSVNGPIVFGGVPIMPGDVVLGDNDGLAIVSAKDAETLLGLALERVRLEEKWMAELDQGRSLLDVFSVPEAI